MNIEENLNEYHDSYNSDNKFFDENHYFIGHFAKKLCNEIREKSYRSVLSLGIGHQVVNSGIRKEFEFSLQSHTILEGSLSIIKELSDKISDQKGNVELVHTYFEDYNTDKQFDLIEMGFVLEHVEDPYFILEKYSHFLKPGGTIFIAVPNAKSLHRMIGYEAGLLDNLYKLSEYDIKFGHKRYFDLDSISEVVSKAGFKINKSSGLMLKPITTGQMAVLGWTDNIYNALLKLGDNYPEIANCILIEATI
jgi:ubiquinone/menaquinone biosynthesis C-methylase UbiE